MVLTIKIITLNVSWFIVFVSIYENSQLQAGLNHHVWKIYIKSIILFIIFILLIFESRTLA